MFVNPLAQHITVVSAKSSVIDCLLEHIGTHGDTKSCCGEQTSQTSHYIGHN